MDRLQQRLLHQQEEGEGEREEGEERSQEGSQLDLGHQQQIDELMASIPPESKTLQSWAALTEKYITAILRCY